VYVGAPLASRADRRTLAAQAEGVIAGALQEMQQGAAKKGAVVAEEVRLPAATETLIEPVDRSGRSA
jgi:1-acyl-sn-glycerol-3-phosphate acyltransferase